MKRKIVSVMFLAATLLLFAGCGDDNNGGTGGGPSGSIVIDVTSGTTPDYSWPDDDAFSLSVTRVSDPTVIVWGVATPGLDNVVSAVSHGVVPGGAVQTALPGDIESVLTAGVMYRVSLSRLDQTFGFTDFTP